MKESFKINWGEKELYIGKEYPISINQLVGINELSQYDECKRKIDMWDGEEAGPDIITDVSLCIPNDRMPLWKYALEKNKYIIGAVPSYYLRNKQCIDREEILFVIEDLLSLGVKIITIHPTVTFELIELSKSRITPITSRGGGIIARDMIVNNSDNQYRECLEEISELCLKYDAVISIGTAFRPANIIDSMDEVHIKEILLQMEIARNLNQRGVKVIIELPGHTPPKKISDLNLLLEKCRFPIMPLGPVVTDVGIGMDHITSAIGQILLGQDNNLQIITAMTAEEHTGNIPTIESIKEAVITAKLVAHILDMEKFNDYSRDYQIALKRKKTCIVGKTTMGCSRCKEYCPLFLNL